jgi:hypothetical protein
MTVQTPRPAADPDGLGALLFRFALVADTHVNESERRSTSHYATNGMANGRARYVLSSLARTSPPPAFGLHLGDIVHPVPELPTFEPAVAIFREMAASLPFPFHLIPGNHDVGDKRVDWMPAGAVTAEHVEQYRRLLGPDRFAFDHGGCRFVAMNAQLFNSGLAEEAEQREWLESQIATAGDLRVFVFSHYPPYVSEPDEPGSYDNIDEPARGWLLGLMRSPRVEAFFAGHVHNFWYDRIGPCRMYLLPATSFMRHDYSEFFRVGPVAEFGRDDAGKFGHFVVDVHERGHVAHFVPSGGRVLEPGQALAPEAPAAPAVHTRTCRVAALGVDLRHPWAERVEIAATGGVQEFERKLARNDYPVLALWGMGVRRLRVPLQDFADERVRARMALLREVGNAFLVHAYGLPAAATVRALEASRGLVSALEIVLPHAAIAAALPTLAELRERTGADVYVSKLRTHEDAKFDGSKFSHFINHGFVLAETHQIEPLAAAASRGGSISGVSLRVSRRERPWALLRQADARAAALGFSMLAHVRLAGESPAETMDDDRANACRIVEAALAAAVSPRVLAVADTFMDVDRGYFPRTGLIDRRSNLRAAGRAYANLHGLLSTFGAARPEPVAASEAVLGATSGPNALLLLLPGDDWALSLAFARSHAAADAARLFDLASGTCLATGGPDALARHAAAVDDPCALLLGGSIGA